jgi:hypothetical protein
MKKLTLALAGLMVLGANVAMADGSKVEANKNTNLNIVNKSEVEGSTVGMEIKAKGSKVKANDNVNLNIVNKSKVKNSTVGMKIDAE